MSIKANSPIHKIMQLGAGGAAIPAARFSPLPTEHTATDTQLRSLERMNLVELERDGFTVKGGRLNGNGLRRLAELNEEAERLARYARNATAA